MVSSKSIHQPKKLKTDLFLLLRKEIEETFGRKMATSGDCIELSEEIYFKTNSTINSNTLRRFFGLVKAQYPPSASTLHILSKYCGFSSTDELVAVKQKNEIKPLGKENLNFLTYLINIFKSILVRDSNDETYKGLVKQTILYISQNPKLADKFQRAIVKTKNGYEYYFEQFIHTDKLNSFYGDGLRYYLNEKKTVESQIFGYSLLCMRDWLNEDDASLKKNLDHIKMQQLPRNTSKCVYARYFSAQLFYADAFHLDTEKIVSEAYREHAKTRTANEKSIYKSFEYILLFTLVLTSHFEEALYYAEHISGNYSKQHSSSDQGSYKRLQLLSAIAFSKTGNTAKAEKIFQQLKPSQFYFLSKNTDTLLYLALAHYLHKSNNKMHGHALELINKTGFTRLQSMIK